MISTVNLEDWGVGRMISFYIVIIIGSNISLGIPAPLPECRPSVGARRSE